MNINIWAVLTAAVSSFMLGGLWYGPLFKAAWCREAGIDPDCKPKSHPAMVFGFAFLLSVLAALGLAEILGQRDVLNATGVGAFVGLCWVGTSFGINYLFAGRSFKLWLIDAGYHTLQFTLYGLILGLWH